jgi:hypothetical protein
MVLYNCKRCFKQFKQKSNYETHLTRKNPCKKIEQVNNNFLQVNDNFLQVNDNFLQVNDNCIQNNKLKGYTCAYCNKTITRKFNLNYHIKNICKIKKKDDINKEQIYQQLLNEHLNIKNENETIKTKLTELENKISKGNTINNNINNGTINNIQIIAHGKEDLSKIKEDVVLQLVKRGWRSVPMFTEYLHCNDKFPEQKNIYINDINRKYCMVYNGNKWLLKNKTETIDELYQTKFDFLEENFNTYYDQLEDYQQRSFKNFIKLHKEDAPFVKKIKEELKTLLYNKRNKIFNNL